MSGTLHYRLVLRDPEDLVDEVTLSSLPADANPFLTAPPDGDGESLDPLTGKIGLADYVLRVADEVGTLLTPGVVMDEQWTYADITARNAVWAKTTDQAGAYSYTFLPSGTDPLESVTGDNGGFTGSAGDLGALGINMHVGIVYGGGIGGGGGFGKHTRTLTGLTPGGAYTVVCDRVRLSRARGAFDNCGLSVNGGGGQTNGLDGRVAVAANADGSGNLTITLGHFDLEYGMTGMAMTFGRIRVYGTGGTVSARIVTGLLADSGGRWTGVNRRAALYESTTSGSSWTPVFVGWLTQATLTGGIEWELHIGDSDRREQRAQALTTLPSGDGWTATPLIGNLFGTTWRFHVFRSSDTNGDLPSQTVALRLDSPSLTAADTGVLNEKARPFASGTAPTITFPTLQATLWTAGGTPVGAFTPWGQNALYFFSPMRGLGTGDLLMDFEGEFLMLQWPGTLPADGTAYDVQVGVTNGSAAGGPTTDFPFVFIGHPVDLAVSLLAAAGSPLELASVATTAAALGAGLQVTYAFTATAPLMDLLPRVAFGPFGFAMRKTLANTWEFFLTRRLPDSAPAETITASEVHTPEQTTYDGDLATQVTQVTWTMRRFTDGYGQSGQTVTERYQSVDAPIRDYGVHEQVYDLPGFSVAFGEDFADVVTPIAPGAASNADPFRYPESQAILARWGRGTPLTELSVLRSAALAARIGDFVTVDLDHKPTVDLTATPTGVRGGARILQIIQRTLKPEGWQLRLWDAGITGDLSAPALTVPAFTLAQGTDTRHVATATLTNDVALAGLTVEYQVSTGANTPTGGTLLTPITPDAVAHDLPSVPAGSTVWARARSHDTADLPSAWSAWSSVALDPVPPVTALATSAGANDTERVVTWTVGDATLPVRVRWKATADANYTGSITLAPGSATYTITGVIPGTAMTVEVVHLDVAPYQGSSMASTATWTAGATIPTLTAPTNPQGFTDGAGTFGLRVTASVLPSRTVFMMAIETGVGTGVYGTPVEVGNITSVAGASACVVTLTRANDGLRVQLTARHAKAGYSDSADTAAVTVNPWETTPTIPPDASDAAYALVGAVPASLPNGRQLAGESGVVSVTDAGAGSTLTLGLTDGGVPLAKLAAGAATDGQVATYDTTNGWQPESVSGVAVQQATDLAPLWSGGLSESILLVGITTGRVALQYSVDNGSTWRFADGTAGPYVSVETAGVQRGAWVTPEAGFTGATNDVLCRVVAVDASSTVTELNERLRFWKNPGNILSARIGADFLVAGAFSTDPVIGNVVVEFNAAAVSAPAPPDPPGDGGTSSGTDTLPISRGLLAWHLCDKGSFAAPVGSRIDVNQLDDLSGHSNHLTLSGGTKASTVLTNADDVIPDLNSRHPVSFRDAYMPWPTSLFTGVTAAEVFIVVRAGQGDPTNDRKYSWIMGTHTGAGNQPQWAKGTGGAGTGDIVEDFGSSTLRTITNPSGTLDAYRVFNVRAASGVWVAALDGTVIASDTINTVAFSSAPKMGSFSENSWVYVAEIVIHSVVLTTAERASQLAAIQARWGL